MLQKVPIKLPIEKWCFGGVWGVNLGFGLGFGEMLEVDFVVDFVVWEMFGSCLGKWFLLSKSNNYGGCIAANLCNICKTPP